MPPAVAARSIRQRILKVPVFADKVTGSKVAARSIRQRILKVFSKRTPRRRR